MISFTARKQKQRKREGDTTAKNCMKIARTPSAMLSGRPAKGLCWGKGFFPPPTIPSCPEPAHSRPEPVVTALGQKHGWEAALTPTERQVHAPGPACIFSRQETPPGAGWEGRSWAYRTTQWHPQWKQLWESMLSDQPWPHHHAGRGRPLGGPSPWGGSSFISVSLSTATISL